MRRWFLGLMGLVALASCGVDGEPVRPALNAGVGISTSGVHAGGSVGVNKGPLNLTLGF
ncbi:lipoprotein, putative [Roseobacter sp. SK209-2-6]|uniref:hypothetical protein n=1 Tax=Roseobacter sp. SK209-2-6 TaxID=388739 RepID=UPI0000F3D2BF|nr:hypothetical protein [Roseobacter sp. SK209-2-6]EBA15048.1 lipoprotein, putative [Roseobacter sp. SK209-2-6]